MASLAQPGDIVATEALVESGIITNASILKLELRGIELDEQGMVPEALEDWPKSQTGPGFGFRMTGLRTA